MMAQLCRVSKQITRMEKEMLQVTKKLEFEHATELRDPLKKLSDIAMPSNNLMLVWQAQPSLSN